MIKVSIKKENDLIKQIKITGHADYDEYGKDIVCASCSSILITTVNAILSIDKDAINYQDKKDFEMNVLKDNEIVNKLINNMILLLEELKHDYPKNIKINN